MGWNRQPVFVHQPPPRPETPKDRYLIILEAEPYSEYAAAVAYFLGRHEDTRRASGHKARWASLHHPLWARPLDAP